MKFSSMTILLIATIWMSPALADDAATFQKEQTTSSDQTQAKPSARDRQTSRQQARRAKQKRMAEHRQKRERRRSARQEKYPDSVKAHSVPELDGQYAILSSGLILGLVLIWRESRTTA